MNPFDDKTLSEQSFAYRDLLGQDKWTSWTPVFTSLTVIKGYVLFRTVQGRRQIRRNFRSFSAATSICLGGRNDYLDLPIAAKGLTGISVMTNQTTNVSVGVCHIDVANSRCYLPTQTASTQHLQSLRFNGDIDAVFT